MTKGRASKGRTSKVKVGHAVANEIVKSKKDLPPKIKELFQKINNDLKIKDTNNGNFS